MKCPNCKYEFPDNNTEFCPNCGEDLRAEDIMNEPTLDLDAVKEEATLDVTEKTVDLSAEAKASESDEGNTVETDETELSEAVTEEKPEDGDCSNEEITAEEEREPTLSSVTFAAIEEELMAMEKEEKEKEPAPAPASVPAADHVPVKKPAPAPGQKPAPNALADLSEVWPEWHVDKRLGRGSYGSVYRAVRRDSNVESFAAVKVISIPSDPTEIESLRCEGLDDKSTKAYFKSIVDDFVSEISLMESLKGIQNIVSVEDYKVVEKVGTIGWDIYIRMELLTPFNAFIRDRIMTERQVLALGIDICTALEICQKCNIIHRDIKPENIFINSFGHYKLGDFGIARKLENVTGVLSHKGTYNYMAPEVANNGRYDARVDTYSLGVMLYRLLNHNRLPFIDSQKQVLSPNDRRIAVERRISGEPLPAPVGASLAMTDVILRACAFDPEDRFPTPTAMKAALISVAKGTYVVRAPATARRNPPAPVAPVVPARNQDPATVLFAPASNPQPASQSTVMFDPSGVQGPVAVSNFTREQDKVKKQKKNKAKKQKGARKGIVLAIIAVCAILALIVGTGAFYYMSPGHNAAKSFIADKYDEALELYHDKVEKNGLQEFILNMHLKGHSAKIVERYNKGEIDLAATHAALSALAEMGYADAEKEDKKIIASRANSCLDSFSLGKITYEEAKAELTLLGSYGYENFQSNIAAIMDTYANAAVADYKAGKADYDTTMAILLSLKAEDYKGADKLIEGLMNGQVTDIIDGYMSGALDYEGAKAALEALEAEGQDKNDTEAALETIRESYANSVLGEYKAGELTYDEALAILEDLKAEGSETADEVIATLDALNDEDTLLSEAMTLFAEGEYVEALGKLEGFTDDNERIDEAEELWDDICDAYLEKILSDTETLVGADDYKGAADGLSAAIESLPEKAKKAIKELEKELKTVLEDHREYVGEKVDSLCNEESFEAAMTLIADSEWNVEDEDDKFYEELRADVEVRCVESVTSSVEEYLEGGQLEIAAQMVENALVLFPENEDLLGLQEDVQDAIELEEKRTEAYIGVVFEDITDSAMALEYFESEETGVYVMETVENYNDDVLQYGDRIVSVNGTAITDKAQLEEIISDHKAGNRLTFGIMRDGTEILVAVYCYNLPEFSEG